MSCTVVDSLLRILSGHQTVNKAGCEGIAAADAVHDLKSVVLLGLIDLAVCPADCLPVIDGSGLYGTKGSCDCLEVRINLCGMIDHLLVAVDVKLLQSGILSLDLQAEAGSEVFFVSDHDVNVLRNFLVDLLALLKAADCGPHGWTIVQVIGNESAVLLRGLDGLDDGLAALLGERCVNSAGVEPACTKLTEDVLEVQILRSSLGDCSVRTVGAADCAAYAKAALCEVQTIAADAADSIGLLPVNQGSIHTALLDEILHQTANLVVCKSSDNGSVHAEALVQAADNVVFSAAFPCTEAASSADAAFTGIQSKHNLAEGYGIILAVLAIFQIQFHDILLSSQVVFGAAFFVFIGSN